MWDGPVRLWAANSGELTRELRTTNPHSQGGGVLRRRSNARCSVEIRSHFLGYRQIRSGHRGLYQRLGGFPPLRSLRIPCCSRSEAIIPFVVPKCGAPGPGDRSDQIPTTDPAVRALCFAPNGRFLALGGQTAVLLWDLEQNIGTSRWRQPRQPPWRSRPTARSWRLRGKTVCDSGTVPRASLSVKFKLDGLGLNPGLFAKRQPDRSRRQPWRLDCLGFSYASQGLVIELRSTMPPGIISILRRDRGSHSLIPREESDGSLQPAQCRPRFDSRLASSAASPSDVSSDDSILAARALVSICRVGATDRKGRRLVCSARSQPSERPLPA